MNRSEYNTIWLVIPGTWKKKDVDDDPEKSCWILWFNIYIEYEYTSEDKYYIV